MNKRNRFSEITLKNYLKKVKDSNILEAVVKPEKSTSDFINTLNRCKIAAQEEFVVCHHEIVDIFENILAIEAEIIADINKINSKHRSYEESWKEVFANFNFQLNNILDYANENLIGSFEKKISKIDTFSICLFGRTKVGKSTTMEALTKGSGKTIGIGKQDTTKTSTEYYWNNLKIIDTPGIDSIHNDKQLEDIALSYADEADLIAFLLPHQIEEGDFEKFKLFYKQNKPIIILLNVKGETGIEGSRDLEMFLKSSHTLFEDKKITGYKNRINDYIFKTLNIEEGLVPIIPIHSKSAFLSNSVTDTYTKIKLFEISNFMNLEKDLIREVSDYGELYRIKNPHDTVNLFSKTITTSLAEFHKNVTAKQNIFSKNVNKFTDVKNSIILKQNLIIKREIEALFINKRQAVNSIVEEIFNTKKEESRNKITSDFLNENEIRQRVNSTSAEIQKIINKEIADFFTNFGDEIKILDLEQKKSSYFSNTNKNIKNTENINTTVNILEGTGVVISAISGIGMAVVAAEGVFLGAALGAEGTLFGLGGANIWNPIGWAMIGVSVVIGIIGYKSKQRHVKKVKEAKNTAVKDLNFMLIDVENKVNTSIIDSIAKSISSIESDHIDIMKEYVKYSSKYIKLTEQLILKIESTARLSEKQKFQSMLNNILNSKVYLVENISQVNQNIEVQLNNLPNSINEIQKIFSRVEEKIVTFCKN